MNKFYLFSAMVMGVALTACESDGEPPRTYQNVTVSVGDKYTIPQGDDCVWHSGDPVVATVENDVVTANYVGAAKIWSAVGNFIITIDPVTTLYVDPIMQWGGKLDDIKGQLKSEDGYTLKSSTETTLVYDANTLIDNQMNTSCTYNFEIIQDNRGREVTSLINVVETLDASVTETTVRTALGERYPTVSENEYVSTDGTMIVILGQAIGAYTVTYAPAASAE